jgi:hypothetical protein
MSSFPHTGNREPMKCIAAIWSGYSHSQCTRAKSIGDYCKQHDPATVEAKRKAKFEAWDAKWAASNAKHARESRLAREYPRIAQEFIDFLESDGRKIEADNIRERIK